MTTTVEAVYEKGTLTLPSPLPLPEKAHVMVTISTEIEPKLDTERNLWLTLSEEALTRTWNNPADEVFNELLQK